MYRIRSRAAFSLVEVLVSLSILGMAAAALLLTNETMNLRSRDAVAQTIANGIARQIVDDVAGLRYMEPGETATATPLGTEAGETTTPPRTVLFDDLDDYHRLELNPLVDPWGIPYGQGDGTGGLRTESLRVTDGYFSGWRAIVAVAYVNENAPTVELTGGATSGMRAVTVTILRTVGGETDQLAQVRRVFSYVPSL